MLILTANGLSSPELLSRAAPHLSKKRCALVTTASVGYKENDRNVPRLAAELINCGAQNVACFDFDTQSPQAFSEFDAAMLIDGNPFYLLHAIRAHGFADPLRSLAHRGTLLGVSAGSMVLTPSIGIAALFTPEMNAEVGLTSLTGLALCGREILPHYSKFKARFDGFEARTREYERQRNVSLARLEDGEALFLDF